MSSKKKLNFRILYCRENAIYLKEKFVCYQKQKKKKKQFTRTENTFSTIDVRISPTSVHPAKIYIEQGRPIEHTVVVRGKKKKNPAHECTASKLRQTSEERGGKATRSWGTTWRCIYIYIYIGFWFSLDYDLHVIGPNNNQCYDGYFQGR